MSKDQNVWLAARELSCHVIKHINRLSKMASKLTDTTAGDSFYTVLKCSRKKAYDLQRTVYKLQNEGEVEDKSIIG